jgi:hypothetical protein
VSLVEDVHHQAVPDLAPYPADALDLGLNELEDLKHGLLPVTVASSLSGSSALRTRTEVSACSAPIDLAITSNRSSDPLTTSGAS